MYSTVKKEAEPLSERWILEAIAVTKHYPGLAQPVVDRLDLRLAPGELLGLLGPNGAGKTTLLSMASTLLRPDSGTLAIAGMDGLRCAPQVRGRLGVVPQELALYPSLTLRENLRFWGRMYGLRRRPLQLRIDECAEFTALGEVLDRPIATFSGGMKRRANLAAGILHRPEILFLDEPTVGIDPQSRHLIFDNLRQLNRQGMAMVYTTHYMEEVHQLCSRVMIIDSGQQVAEGAIQPLLAAHDCTHLEELFLHLTGKHLRD